MSRTVYPAYIKKDTKAQGKEAKALLKTLKAESESYKRKQIDGRSIRNYTYKKSQNDKAEGVSNEYEPKHGEQTNGIQREETVVYTRDDRRVRGRGGPAGYRDDGRGKEKSDSFHGRTKEESNSFLRRTAEKGLRRREVGKRYYAYRPVKSTIKERSYYERTYGETIHRIYEHIESIKTEQNRDTGDLLNAGNRRHAVRDAGQDERKGLQTDAAGNDEHLRGRHQGASFR